MGKREGGKHQCVVSSYSPPTGDSGPQTQACGPTGNQTSDPLVRRPALNPLSHTSQGPHILFNGCIVVHGEDVS